MGLYLIAETDLPQFLGTLANILKVLFGVGFVIFVHELGHFLAAKSCGVKCEKFYVGFDVPKWSLFGIPMPSRFASFQWGETEYGIGLVPLGGYVKMLGQDDNPANAAKEAERIRQQAEEEGVAAASLLDPRSYPAKNVPQRMLIISAGIIMNLIFAVIMAAIAYRMGISYLTCELNGATPGDPAWTVGLKPGDKILQVGRSGDPNEYLRFDKDLQIKVLSAGLGQDEPTPIDVLVRRDQNSPDWVTILPRFRGEGDTRRATLGVLGPTSTTLAQEKPVVEYRAAGKAEPPLAAGDRIVAVQGEPLDRQLANQRGDLPGFELDRRMANRTSEPLRLTVERTKDGQTSQVEVTVPPSPMKWLGVRMAIGPVVSVQKGSPAETAGIKEGYVLRTINGEPVGDPLTLPERWNELSSQSVALGFEVPRAGKGAKSETPASTPTPSTPGESTTGSGAAAGDQAEPQLVNITVTPRTGVVTAPIYSLGGYLALDSLGLAYQVRPVVAGVEPGSEAEKQGVAPGAQVVAIQFLARDEQANEYAKKWLSKKYNEIVELDEMNNWVYIHGALQELPPNIEARLILRHDGHEKTVTLLPREIPGIFTVERGLVLTQFERVHTASDFGEAFALGYRETKERLGEVASVLGLLVRGRLSMNNLGGPIRIAAFAGYEAAQGISRLLIFLTFLSANLALLNALPIPVLDGGHFMFLLVEGIIRRPVPEKWQSGLTFVGFACLLALMLFVFANDVKWLFL